MKPEDIILADHDLLLDRGHARLPQVASASTTAMAILHAIRDCIDKSAPSDDGQSLERSGAEPK